MNVSTQFEFILKFNVKTKSGKCPFEVSYFLLLKTY